MRRPGAHRSLCARGDVPSHKFIAFSCLLTPSIIVYVSSLQHSYLGRTVDVALGVALPLHSHVAINSVLSDYVPKSVRGESVRPMPSLMAVPQPPYIY